MISLQIVGIIQRLLTPDQRAEAAEALAKLVEVQRVMLFARDLEVDAFLPALGMMQTLRGGAQWQKFLRACANAGQFMGVLPVPGEPVELVSIGICDVEKRCILVFIGEKPNDAILDEIRPMLPLLAGKLIEERIVISATANAEVAREATKKAQQLNAALDKNRFQLKAAIAIAERELAQRRLAEDKLKEADRYKNNFLATLAHELRNPLGAISIAVELQELLNLTPAGPATDAQKTIKRQTAHLTHLVNDLLEVSRVSLGKVELQREQVRIGDFIDSALEMARPVIDRYHHTLQVNVSAPSVTVFGDVTRLAQIVSNLLENAAKYTPQSGEIVLDVKIEDGHVVIAVCDNGIGITQEAHAHLFTMFSQLDRVDGTVAVGLGIGLSLVKKFVELHDGMISAASEGSGRGTQFTVRIPLQPRLPVASIQNLAQSVIS